MCRFKSGIILKTRCVVADGADDSHSELLRKLGIEDTTENAITKFVRVELVPPDDAWWTDPGTWIINVDQDLLPDWFNDDREKYCEDFREVVKEWWKIHVIVDKKIDELNSGHYKLKRCEVKALTNDVDVMCDSSKVNAMYGNSIVNAMYGSSKVNAMYGSSKVDVMCDSSKVNAMYGNSKVDVMCDSSKVNAMYGNSIVNAMYGSSIARDFKDRQKARIIISDSNSFEIVTCNQ